MWGPQPCGRLMPCRCSRVRWLLLANRAAQQEQQVSNRATRTGAVVGFEVAQKRLYDTRQAMRHWVGNCLRPVIMSLSPSPYNATVGG
jgi:hypothetical protein